ncbi:TlpA disulfide reductase family protein, partial [Geobacillus sp. CAMR5420]|uniref:TlpA disulfide reductase family protein n=1 Tax=Geobacillus sp. CAMR5420 TaxID=1482739 RepID=UPI001F517595
MQKFYEQYKDEGVEIVAVNLTQSERQPEHVARFIQEYGITFTVVLDEKGEVSRQYQAQAIPTSYLIDSKGIIQKRRGIPAIPSSSDSDELLDRFERNHTEKFHE